MKRFDLNILKIKQNNLFKEGSFEKKNLISIIIGLITGFANGLFGAGGGAILVPLLERFLKVETYKAHATAISIILPLSVISSFIYLKGIDADFSVILPVALGGVFGAALGATILKKIPKNILHKIFGIFMAIAAVRMIF